jgi:hypothetical protein
LNLNKSLTGYVKLNFFLDMPRKCSVANCTTNYDTDSTVNLYHVYQMPRCPEKLKLWLSALPNIIEHVTDNMGICKKHWPENAPMEKVYRSRYLVGFYPERYKLDYVLKIYFYQVPKDPPSIFLGCENSMKRQTAPTMSRNVSQRNLSLEIRAAVPDELDEFMQRDNIIDWNSFCREVACR